MKKKQRQRQRKKQTLQQLQQPRLKQRDIAAIGESERVAGQISPDVEAAFWEVFDPNDPALKYPRDH